MAIITISRGSYSKGQQIAEKVAKTLGYQCISREVLLEASKEFNIPEVKLVRVIDDAPSILGRFAYGKKGMSLISGQHCSGILKKTISSIAVSQDIFLSVAFPMFLKSESL